MRNISVAAPVDHWVIGDPSMVGEITGRVRHQIRLIGEGPLATIGAGSRIGLREACVPGRMGDGGEVATSLARADHVAYPDGWRRSRAGTMWRATPPRDAEENWLAAVHMPDWACRLVLTVTSVRREPLGSIGRADLRAEGYAGLLGTGLGARRRFAQGWDRTHSFAGARWCDNPDVLVLGFEAGGQP